MLNELNTINQLQSIVGADFEITLKNNEKGVITITFTDEDTHEKVNLKFNEETNTTTVAPREMQKETFIYAIQQNLEEIKECLKNNNE